jgi:hypothetical protein
VAGRAGRRPRDSHACLLHAPLVDVVLSLVAVVVPRQIKIYLVTGLAGLQQEEEESPQHLRNLQPLYFVVSFKGCITCITDEAVVGGVQYTMVQYIYYGTIYLGIGWTSIWVFIKKIERLN